MNARFDELMASVERDGLRLNQHVPEWRVFLEYVSGYFLVHGLMRPVVVEIGILDGAQRRFYEHCLNAEYIGIDSKTEGSGKGKPDILGNSRDPETRKSVETLLAGRMIDLLFIDGDHSYPGVKSDYEIYGPLTRHVIAIHDIHTPTVDVRLLWGEILSTNRNNTLVTIQRYNPRDPNAFNGRQMGIGLIVKDGYR